MFIVLFLVLSLAAKQHKRDLAVTYQTCALEIGRNNATKTV